MCLKKSVMSILLCLSLSSCATMSSNSISKRQHGGISFGKMSVHDIYVTDKYSKEDLDMFLRSFYVAFIYKYGEEASELLINKILRLTLISTSKHWTVEGIGTDRNGVTHSNPKVVGLSSEGNTIIFKEEGTLDKTSLAHELMHQALHAVYGQGAFDHNANKIWKLHAEEVIALTNSLYKEMKKDEE